MNRFFAFVSMLFGLTGVFAQNYDNDVLASYISQHPNVVEKNIVYEGTKLNLSADDDFLFLNFSVRNPELQMRLMMLPTTIYIDPSGKKRKNYGVTLPCVNDVQELLTGYDAPDANVHSGAANSSDRPDILPLLGAMNRHGATFIKGKEKTLISSERFHVELDRENEVINYYVLLPKEPFIAEKRLKSTWTAAVISPNRGMTPPPSMDEGERMPGVMDRPGVPPNRDAMQRDGMTTEDDLRAVLQGDIVSWVEFNIDDVNNANLDNEVTTDDMPLCTLHRNGDTLQWKMQVTRPQQQLTLLMQGMTVSLVSDDAQIDLEFPDASVVRHKLRRHPNEVKPSFVDSTNTQEVRPDIQPLVEALSSAHISVRCITSFGETVLEHSSNIILSREDGILTYSVQLAPIALSGGNVMSEIVSAPKEQTGEEFVGQSRTEPAQQAPTGGLGTRPDTEGINQRTIRFSSILNIQNQLIQ